MNSPHRYLSPSLPLISIGPRYQRAAGAACWRLPAWLVAFAGVLAALLLASAAKACPPDPAGDPNKQCAAAGNPINVMTGNKYQREEDMPALPGVLGLELVRHYNSALSSPGNPNGPLGRGWRLSYETEIVDLYGKIQVLEADGGRIIFDRDPKKPTGCSTANPANGTMTLGRQPDGKPDYTWIRTDGRKLHFNAAGKLDRITAATGEVVRLLYDSQNVLVRVIDPQGRSLNLAYYDRKTPNHFHGVQFIDTPVGRFEYEYGSSLPKGAGLFDQRQLLANLVRVRLPNHFDPDKKAHALSSRGTTRSTLSRTYHHEDPRSPWLMTGISIETIGEDGKAVTTRYSTYGYDDTGRAILSTHAGNVDKITLDNHEAGKTVLTNSLGQKTVYRYTVIAGEYRLLEVRGAGCSLCGEPNVRYGYDDAGRRTETTKLTEDGKPIMTTRTERDKLGRVTRESKITYLNRKPSAAQLQARFTYQGDRFAPSLVVRPSVVPGKEVETRIDYNEAGQPLAIAEYGWSPAVDGKHAAVRIERIIRYRYAIINGRSLLTEIDGPLANGKTTSPAESDVTILEYDHRPVSTAAAPAGALSQYERRDGLLTRVIAPGNLVTEVLERDAALRPTRLQRTDGGLVQEISVARNWRSAPLHLEQIAGAPRHKMEYEYNELGELAAVTMPGNLRTAFAHDSTARRNLSILPGSSGLPSDQALQLSAFSREVYSLIGPAKIDPAFAEAVSHTAAADAQRGTAEGIQMRTGVAGSTSGRLIEELFRTAHGQKEVVARRWLDDFGRLVAVQYAGQGVTYATYHGGSERVATLTDALGIATQLEYNPRGQLTMLERRGRDGKLTERIQYKHQGSWLVEVAKYSGINKKEPENRIRFVHDGFGQITQEIQTIGTTSYCVNHAYDDAGRITKTWLTEYSGTTYSQDLSVVSMRYASDARMGGQIDSIRAGDGLFGQGIVISGLRWLMSSTPLATAWRFGNGLQARGQYEAVKGQQTSFAWRLREFHDGLHPYKIRTDESGHINEANQQKRGTLAQNDSWRLMPEAHATPALADVQKVSSMMVASPAADANNFDAGGRMRRYRSAQGELDLTWDSAGHLVQVDRDGKRVSSYGYDALGRRVSKTVDAEKGAKRVFIYSGEQLIAEASDGGTILKQFVYLGWRPVAWIEPARTLVQRLKQYLFGPKIVYLQTDHRGAVTAATDVDRRILWDNKVDAFGNLQRGSHDRMAVEQPLRLAGQYADQETGLFYNLARYYDPRTGNFISPDPAGLEAGSVDLYAYANGDPLNYFDPDGWAKVVYYAITSKADGKTALGTNQGFTKARWAFVVSGIKDGVKENVIYDPTGGFVKSSFATAKGDAFAWNNSEEGYVSDPTLLLKQYYGDTLISLSEFTVDNFDDAKARAILEKLGYSGEKTSCAQAALPEISFASGDTPIDVTNSAANGANKQRILNCSLNQTSAVPVQYAGETERNRVEKYEAAAELNETSWLGKDCSHAGCPGVDITGQTGIVYHASYGRSQFTGNTFLETINRLPREAKETLGVTEDMQGRIANALARALQVGRSTPPTNPGAFTKYRNRYNCPDAARAWDNAGQTAQLPPAMTAAERTDFQANTGLERQAFIDMVCFIPSGDGRPLGEGRNAFMTEAIFTDATLRTWMMGIFRGDEKFGYISRTLLRADLNTVLNKTSLSSNFLNAESPTLSDGAINPAYKTRQRSIEEELAMRVARLHNGGKNIALSSNTSALTSACTATNPSNCDKGNYVRKFIGIINDGHGDWRSLRCAADAKSSGTGGAVKWRGLEFNSLKLPSN